MVEKADAAFGGDGGARLEDGRSGILRILAGVAIAALGLAAYGSVIALHPAGALFLAEAGMVAVFVALFAIAR